MAHTMDLRNIFMDPGVAYTYCTYLTQTVHICITEHQQEHIRPLAELSGGPACLLTDKQQLAVPVNSNLALGAAI